MPYFLSSRDTSSREHMDNMNCDPAELNNTYRQFNTINTLISQWRIIYNNKIRPHLKTDQPNTLLDIGFGGGDIPIKLAKWASSDGLKLDITAIDSDPRALDFIHELQYPPNVSFLQCAAVDLNRENQRFDFVISNHLLHHLSAYNLSALLETAKKLSIQSVLFNDIHRSDFAYFLFHIFATPVFRSSFITHDGLTSIKRSYTYRELVETVPGDWQVKRLFPFRLLLSYHHE